MNSYVTFSEAYRDTLRLILESGKEVKPRGMSTRELIGHSFRITNPHYNVVGQKTRKISLPFMAAESIWIISGSNDFRVVTPYNSKMKQFSDDGLFFRGAYGLKIIDQLPYILENLLKDQESRQALLTIWRERPGPSKDIPCTIMMQFFIREGELDLVVYMRSNDAWLGLPYDVFTFTQLQKYVANLLGITPRFYHHHVGSLHLYEANIDQAVELVGEDLKQVIQVNTGRSLVAPIPPEVLTVFTGMSLLGERQGVTPADVAAWLDLSGVNAFPEWLELLQLCAYRFHKLPELLPANYQPLYRYWRAGS